MAEEKRAAHKAPSRGTPARGNKYGRITKSTMTSEEKIRRASEVVRMRREKMTYEDIGNALNPPLSPSTVCGIYKEALANHPLTQIQIDEHRLEETEFIDVALRNLLKIATSEQLDHNGRPMVSTRTRVEAWTSMRSWVEHKAKLLGLFAPTQHQVVTLGAIDEQIIRLEAELGLQPGAELPVSSNN